MTNRAPVGKDKFGAPLFDDCGQTFCGVYVVELDSGDEIGSFSGRHWDDSFIARLEKEHGPITAYYTGGTLDGLQAI